MEFKITKRLIEKEDELEEIRIKFAEARAGVRAANHLEAQSRPHSNLRYIVYVKHNC